jgi:hypothetical protein
MSILRLNCLIIFLFLEDNINNIKQIQTYGV